MPNAFGYSSYPQRPAVKPSDVGAALLRRAQPMAPAPLGQSAVPMAGVNGGGSFGPMVPQPAPQSPFGVR